MNERTGKLLKVGNSSALVIRANELFALGVKQGDTVKITYVKGRLVIEKIKEA
ncbi:MAG: AbrB/MazE/SpoVT family DNA-binding domain-containing protein [Shewanella sp.]|uniref:AbrB/MazE/SpoVT family DNA-binding domain-containing protein n=1 Tax=Shewanella sp. TaxID=50422 RepID=UPI003F2FB1C0